MGYEAEKNWTEVGKLAYKIYVKRMYNDPTIHEHATDWYVHANPEYFKEYYKLAEVELRKQKIDKILWEK